MCNVPYTFDEKVHSAIVECSVLRKFVKVYCKSVRSTWKSVRSNGSPRADLWIGWQCSTSSGSWSYNSYSKQGTEDWIGPPFEASSRVQSVACQVGRGWNLLRFKLLPEDHQHCITLLISSFRINSSHYQISPQALPCTCTLIVDLLSFPWTCPAPCLCLVSSISSKSAAACASAWIVLPTGMDRKGTRVP